LIQQTLRVVALAIPQADEFVFELCDELGGVLRILPLHVLREDADALFELGFSYAV
jgi:hypothetical protein